MKWHNRLGCVDRTTHSGDLIKDRGLCSVPYAERLLLGPVFQTNCLFDVARLLRDVPQHDALTFAAFDNKAEQSRVFTIDARIIVNHIRLMFDRIH